MKNSKKSTERKLAFNKETIRNLSESDLEAAVGGMLSSHPGCICSSSVYEEEQYDAGCRAR